jgi:hypothetical protein
MKKPLFILTILLILISWQCSKIDQSKRNLTVRESIENSGAEINTAIERSLVLWGIACFLCQKAIQNRNRISGQHRPDLIAGIAEFSPDTNLRPYLFSL